MAEVQLDFNTPGGRFIGGDIVNKQTTDHLGRPIAPEKQRRSVGIAFPKSQDQNAPINILLGQIYNHGVSSYSQKANGQFALAQAQRWLDPQAEFSWKIKDGDAALQDGSFNENTKNCWVFWFSTTFEIKAAIFENGVTTQIDPATVKRGWYVDIFGNCSINGNLDKTAGVYLNPSVVRVIGYGPEITGGVSVTQAFANAPAPVLPAGASAMPVAGAPIPGQVAQPPVVAAPAQQYAPPAQAALPGFTPPPPQAAPQPIGNGLPATGYPTNVTPHTAFVPGAPAPTAQVGAYTPPGLPGQ